MQWGQVLFRAGVAFKYGMELIGLRRSRITRAIEYLENSNHPSAAFLVNAITESRRKEISPDDETWFDKIESLRNELLSSSEVLHRQDFGAGHALDIEDNPEPVIRKTTVGHLCKVAGTPGSQARLLYHLAKELKPKVGLELGTCLGISAAYQAAAMQGTGKLLSIEGDPATAEYARRNLAKLGLSNTEVLNGPFAELLPETLVSLKQTDYVLIDGHHDGEAMKNYYALIQPWLSQHACVVFDDIDWSSGMQKAWKEMQEQFKFALAIDLGRAGIVIV